MPRLELKPYETPFSQRRLLIIRNPHDYEVASGGETPTAVFIPWLNAFLNNGGAVILHVAGERHILHVRDDRSDDHNQLLPD